MIKYKYNENTNIEEYYIMLSSKKVLYYNKLAKEVSTMSIKPFSKVINDFETLSNPSIEFKREIISRWFKSKLSSRGDYRVIT